MTPRRPAAATGALLAVLLVACGGETRDAPGARRSAVAPGAPDTPRVRTSDSASVASALPTVGHPPAARRVPAADTGSRASARRRPVELVGHDLSAVGHDAGSPTAPVVMIDFSDFGCPYCGEFARETYPALERDYVRTGKLYFKYVPFLTGGFPNSREVTRAAECAAEQGRFWPMLDRVYAAQREWKGARDPLPVIARMWSAAGVDGARAKRCYTSGLTDRRTQRATEVANDIGVRVTPSFVVDGRPVQGALPLAEFRRIIDAALLLARTPR